MDYNLLFILPDKENENILTIKSNDKYQLPTYKKRIKAIEGGAIPQLEDIPQPYNDFFKNLTGISVVRKYMFKTVSNIVFVCESLQNEESNATKNEYNWTSYDKFISSQENDEIKTIANNVRRDYLQHTSHTQHIAWAKSICADKNVRITGDIAQIKSEWVYRIPSNIGDLYMKIVGDPYSELTFTHKLLEHEIPNLPEWVGCNPALGAILMRDMGGEDLSSQSIMEIKDLQNLAVALSHTQKCSIQYVNSADFFGYDYKLSTIINELENFPEEVFNMLQGTQYEISPNEKAKLTHNAQHVISMLRFINNAGIPDTIFNSDMAAYNTKYVNGNYIFYDWAWGGAAHPFFNMSRLLSSVRGMLPVGIPAKDIVIDAYLQEWTEYANINELKEVFMVVDSLLGFSVMFFLKYVRTKHIHMLNAGKGEELPVKFRQDLDERYRTFAEYLKRFINDDFTKLRR